MIAPMGGGANASEVTPSAFNEAGLLSAPTSTVTSHAPTTAAASPRSNEASGSGGTSQQSTVVVDIGCYAARSGFAGDLSPTIDIPSRIGRPDTLLGGSDEGAWICPVRESYPHNIEVLPCIDFDKHTLRYHIHREALSGLLSHLMRKTAGSAASGGEVRVLMTQPTGYVDREFRKQTCDLLFESFSVTSVFCSPRSTLALFGSGRSSGVVLDVGHKQTTASCVLDGFTLPQSVVSYPLGGIDIDRAVLTAVVAATGLTKSLLDPSMNPRLCRPSFVDWAAECAAQRLKAKHCDVRPKPPTNVKLPDGNQILTSSFASVPSILFDPAAAPWWEAPSGFTGVTNAVCQSLRNGDQTLNRDVASGVAITGGTSCFRGFKAKLEDELSSRHTRDLSSGSFFPNYGVVLGSSKTHERRTASWIGGSLFASLGSFNEFSVTLSEYADAGLSALDRKCP